VQRRLFAVIALAGCYAPTLSRDVPCETTCPGDLLCLGHMCLAPDGDKDSDTVPNAIDNCALAENRDQHDEDRDGLGDVCDPCPHIDGGAEDSDGDRVGDDCDPQPRVAKEQWVLFDPFTSSGLQWTFGPGSTVAGDALRAQGSSLLRLPAAAAEFRIVVGGTIDAALAGAHQVAISFSGDLTNPNFYFVEFTDDTTGGFIYIGSSDGVTATAIASANYPQPIPRGAWSMQLDESATAQHIAFSSTLGGVTHQPIMAGPPLQLRLLPSNFVALSVTNVSVTVHYFGAIATMP
jgi:hypothetical protein